MLGILPHREFVRAVHSSQYQAYKHDPRARVRDQAAFKAMQEHLVKLNEGVDVQHSFVDNAGSVFDCVPIDQQPSVRGTKHRIAKPRDLPGRPDGRAPAPSVAPLLVPGRKDRHGNAMHAPEGTIPVRRATLDTLTRFKTLDDFLHKAPSKIATMPKALTPPTPPDTTNEAANHRYADGNHTVANIGAHAFLNLWAPAIGPDQTFSLSQLWFADSNSGSVQTVEFGWTVYPQKFSAQPVLFVFWTPDGYHTGSYNLDAAGFVQTNAKVPLGVALGPVSTTGGTQYEIELGVYLHDGNWWVYYGGTGADSAVGYYPASLYNNGPMATAAALYNIGGETSCAKTGWSGMGSGALASGGWQKAAFDRDIYYFQTGGSSAWASLTAMHPDSACYSMQIGKIADPWNVYFYYGGPGGGDC
ncbi:MAG TPA: neprosin family prolyl endopeptidase [Candidatus Baltobacteraceae bacterium]|nr:neprosin family prolyl endopeptidase [Candidatus Baltobacteraceae bacterium]